MKHILTFLLFCGAVLPATAQTMDEPLVDISLRLEALNAIDQSVAFLLDQQQDDGSFSNHPGITAMAVIALVESPQNGDDNVKQTIAKARSYILSKINDEGAVSLSDISHDVYSTSTCLIALSMVNNPDDKAIISNLRTWLIKHQYLKTGSFSYGGPTGANESYPDLSNTHWALEALTLTSGDELSKEYNVLKFKLANFISSCQIVAEDAGKNKGGFLYYPLNQKPGKASYTNLDKVWGSLTMGALKSLLFSGIKPSDPRIVNGLEWNRKNYDMTKNPGWDQGGWYYYIYMYSSAMVFLGQDYIAVPDGQKQNWRSDLLNELLSRQKNGDHWQNTKSKMWMEGDANLCTAYALKAAYLTLMERKPTN